jgi:hypothetical protein
MTTSTNYALLAGGAYNNRGQTTVLKEKPWSVPYFSYFSKTRRWWHGSFLSNRSSSGCCPLFAYLLTFIHVIRD